MLLEFVISTSLWLVIDPNGARTQWDTQPTAGKVCPGATILALPAGYKPEAIQDYKPDVSGTAVYAPPVKEPSEPALPMPDPTGFLKAVNADELTSANDFALAFQMSGLLAIFQADLQGSNTEALQAHWQAACKTFGESWLTKEVQAMIARYAQEFNIPLVAK